MRNKTINEDLKVKPSSWLRDKVAPAIDKGVHIVGSEELKTVSTQGKKVINKNDTEKKSWYAKSVPDILHYVVLLILVLLVWGLLWFAWGDNWGWHGPWFRLAAVAFMAWASGEALESITSLPPLLAALLTGILARNLGYLDMREFTQIDMFLRMIYPVVILGKGSLGIDTNYVKENWRQIAALGAGPWFAEVTALATCTHFFLGHPWIWGFILGTFYSSVTGPVVLPKVVKVGSSPRRSHIWPQFVGTASALDVILSVGGYGVLSTFLFVDAGGSETYRYIRAFSTPFVAVTLGLVLGCLAGLMPHSSDYYVVELRILFVLINGLFMNFAFSYVGWGGVAGVAVLICNATAARFWSKTGWALNNNPASTAYRVMWRWCEPVLFAYTGTFFVIKSSIQNTILLGFAILLICLTVRLSLVALTCWRLSLKEKLFICSIWSTKSIVEAVLCPVSLNILLLRGDSPHEMQYAEDFVVLTVQEILVTTPLAFLISKYLGPYLLKDKPLELGKESRA